MFFKIKDLVAKLKQGKIIVYPTESVFGLGCDPDNKKAISNLLTIKNRSWKKGFILVAANYVQLLRYINDCDISREQRSRIFSDWTSRSLTWLFPANINVPYWLKGNFSSIAVRISYFEPIYNLCLAFGKPIISTSANISGFPPARTVLEIHNQLGNYHLPIMYEKKVGGELYPSRICDIITGKLIRN